MTGWSSLAPLPMAQPWPAELDRHEPDRDGQRALLRQVTADADWARLSWRELIEALLGLGRTDVPLSRLSEGHIDALRIIGQAGRRPEPDALYGVWASRSGRTGLHGEPARDGWRVTGRLRFASGAGVLDRALVPLWRDDHHTLVELDLDGLPVDASRWRTSAMRASRTFEIELTDVSVPGSAQVGDVDFYLSRPEFFPGGVGVAACWAGGAARVLDLVAAVSPEPSSAQRLRLGRMRTELVAAAAVVRAAADRLDRVPPADQPDPQLLATQARAVVAEAVRRLLTDARLTVGPAGLALDDDLSHAVPDLELYVLQQNSDADAALLGDPGRRP